MRSYSVLLSAFVLTFVWAPRPTDAAIRNRSDVTAAIQVDEEDQDNQLVINGDVNANSIAIVDVGNFRLLIGLNGTTVNGKTFDFFSKDNLLDTVIDMGGGNDLVVVVSAIVDEEEFVAEGGAGNDVIIALSEITVEEGVTLSGFEVIIPNGLGD